MLWNFTKMIFYEVEADVLRFDNFDDAVECCADLNTPFFVDAENKSRSSGLFVLMQWLSRNSPCTEREFALILAAMSAEGMYYTVHSSDDVSQPFRCLPIWLQGNRWIRGRVPGDYYGLFKKKWRFCWDRQGLSSDTKRRISSLFVGDYSNNNILALTSTSAGTIYGIFMPFPW